MEAPEDSQKIVLRCDTVMVKLRTEQMQDENRLEDVNVRMKDLWKAN